MANKTDFAAVLLGHRKGEAHNKVTDELADGIEAVKAHGGKATITLTVVVERGKDTDTIIRTSIDSTAKIPRPKSPPQIWYTGENDTTLNKVDPRQHSLFGDEEPEVKRHDPREAGNNPRAGVTNTDRPDRAIVVPEEKKTADETAKGIFSDNGE